MYIYTYIYIYIYVYTYIYIEIEEFAKLYRNTAKALVLYGLSTLSRYRKARHNIKKIRLRFMTGHKPLEGVSFPESPPGLPLRVLHDSPSYSVS